MCTRTSSATPTRCATGATPTPRASTRPPAWRCRRPCSPRSTNIGRARPDAMRLLVTGGASGLGRAVALGAAQRGAKVVVADIDRAGAEAVAQACGGHALVLDLIAHAEQAGAGEAFLEMKAETWDRTLGLNVKALALATAAAGRIMKEQKSGRIVNITSPASRMALPNYTAYAASKAAVDAITRAAAVALAPHGIRVNSLAPGMMDTPMQRV